MTRSQLIAKIRKCLALAKSANEHEAGTALAMAAKLAAEHGIDLSGIEIDAKSARSSRCNRPPQWESTLFHAVRRAINCHGYWDAFGDACFVGRGANPEIAAYAFTVLRRKLQAARSLYIAERLKRCKIGRKRSRADAYCEGWVLAVYAKIAALCPPVAADPDVEKWLAVHVPGLATVRARSTANSAKAAEDRWRGHSVGQGVELNAGMGSTSGALSIEGARS